jgi:porphobilinogen synthase
MNNFSYRRTRGSLENPTFRSLVREKPIPVSALIYPLFLIEGKSKVEERYLMPGIYQQSIDFLLREIEECMQLGLRAFLLLNETGESTNNQDFLTHSVAQIKKEFPDTFLLSKVALNKELKDKVNLAPSDCLTLEKEMLDYLASTAVTFAKAGIDIIIPSDGLYNSIGKIRNALDLAGYSSVGILAASGNFFSVFTQFSYNQDNQSSVIDQGENDFSKLDISNIREAIRKAQSDSEQGADLLMVQPAVSNLDVIGKFRTTFDLPVVAFQTHGEYAMIKASVEINCFDELDIMKEMLTSISRAGADVIITFFAKQFALGNFR